MNKALGIAAIVGGLAYSIISGDNALAQEKRPYPVPSTPVASAQVQEPIKFGKNRDILYEIGNPDETFDFLFEFAKTAPSKGKNLGKFWIGQDGDFVIWGVLDGKVFKYRSDFDDVWLQLVDEKHYMSLRDVPRKHFGFDSAEVSRRAADGGFPLQEYRFENSDFYETPPLQKESQDRRAFKQIFANYGKWLNVKEIKKIADGAKIIQPIPEPSRSTLENFLR